MQTDQGKTLKEFLKLDTKAEVEAVVMYRQRHTLGHVVPFDQCPRPCRLLRGMYLHAGIRHGAQVVDLLKLNSVAAH